MKCKDWPIGVCSWSLQMDIASVVEAMNKIGIDHMHLAIRPALGGSGNDYLAAINVQNEIISATMLDFPQEDYSTLDSIKATGGIVPDEYWNRNCEDYIAAAKITRGLGVKYLTMHAGFIDESNEEYADKFKERINLLAGIAEKEKIMLLLETGQETAQELRHFLDELDHPAIGINFDPANMILYGKGDPIKAVHELAPWIKHVHIKDAIGTEQPGTWGREVPWGDGQVGPEEFLNALSEIGFEGALSIEREAGNDRFGDIKLAAERLSLFS